MTLEKLLASVRDRIAPVSGEFALPEAERTLEFLLTCSRSGLYLSRTKTVDPLIADRVEVIVARRLADEPLAYILGSAYFYNREFAVTPDTLIPRPDTEILVERVLGCERAHACRFADIGTGSGCIASILTGERPGWSAVAIDRSFAALRIARRNCGRSVRLLCGDLLLSVKERAVFDFIVANPPYIRTDELNRLPRSVREFEPRSALDGGKDGLDFYRRIARCAIPLLKAGGGIYCEIGFDQADAVTAIFTAAGYTEISVTRDYAGHPRVVQARASS
jgi:release factor glutamine methyltransferase